MRTRVRGLAESWARQGHDLALGIGIAQGYATLGRIGFDGRLDYAAIGSVTNLAARLCADAEPWQILVTERVFAAAGSLVVARTPAPASCAASAGASTRSTSRASTTHGPCHDRGPLDAHRSPARRAVRLSEEERYQRFDELQARMAGVWDAMRLNHDDESVVVVPSVTLDRAVGSSGSMTQAIRGAVPVPAGAAAPAAAAHGLRDLDADRPGDRRVLPGAAARRDPQPRPLPAVAGRGARLVPALAEREAAGATATARADRGADPEPGALAPRALQHHRARARRRAEPRDPDVRRRPAAGAAGLQDRLPAAVRRGRRPAPARRRGPAHPRRAWPTPSSACAPSGRRWTASSSSSTRESRVQGTPSSVWPGCPRPGSAGRAGRRDGAAARRWSWSRRRCRSTSTSPSSPRAAASSRSGSPARRSAARASSCGSLPGGAVELLSTHDQLLGGASGQSYLGCTVPGGAGVRPDDHRARRDDRGAARPRGRARPVRGRLRGGARRRRRVDAVRDRAQPAQGRDDAPVPHAAVPHRRPLRPRHRAVPHASRDTRSTWSRPTTSSPTSSAG